MALVSVAPKSRFSGEDNRAFLYTAGEELAPTRVLDATHRYDEQKVQGTRG